MQMTPMEFHRLRLALKELLGDLELTYSQAVELANMCISACPKSPGISIEYLSEEQRKHLEDLH